MTYRADDFIKAIPNSGGIISTIATRVGCAWGTANKYILEHPTVMAAYEDECEQVCDLAVSVIIGNMQIAKKMQKKGELAPTHDAKWWVSKKRKADFGDAIDVTSGGKAIQFGEQIQKGLAELSEPELESLYAQFEAAARHGAVPAGRKEQA